MKILLLLLLPFFAPVALAQDTQNIYGQPVDRAISLTADSINHTRLRPDSLEDYQQNTLSKLVNGDSIEINYRSIGCFSWENLQLKIFRENDNYFAQLHILITHYKGKRKRRIVKNETGDLLQRVQLTDKNIRDFIRFENELMYAKDEGCTTTSWYTVRSKYLTIERTDGTCQWRGFYHLRKSFFGKV